jgi:pimeloyl-ACP methyl ester carboxylesterase
MGATTALLAARGLTFEPAPGAVTNGGVTRFVLFEPVMASADHYAAALDWNQPMAAAAARRKDFFVSHAAAFEAYRGRGAFRTWPDAVLEDYLQDGLRPRREGGFTLACPPSWEAANFAASCMVDPRPALGTIARSLRVLRAESSSTCFLDGPGARYAVETVAGTTHFLPIERPDLVQAALTQAVFGEG